MSNLLAAIEIGGTKLQLYLANSPDQVVEKRRLVVDRATGATGIRLQLESVLREWKSRFAIKAVGVGFGGPVHWQTGRVATSHQIEGWSGFEIKTWLEDVSGLPCFVDNDSNLAGLAEAMSGAGRGFRTVFYTNFGSGVGGSMVQDGAIYHGAFPGECEFGHIRLDKSGVSVESRCSGWAVDRQIREMPERERGGKLWALTRGMSGGEARRLPEALREGDPAAERILRELAENAAYALSHVTHLFHPDVVVVGGGLSSIGEPLRERMQEALPGFVMEVFRPGPPIRLALHGEDVVPIGALHLAAGCGRG
jgi:glucokinase